MDAAAAAGRARQGQPAVGERRPRGGGGRGGASRTCTVMWARRPTPVTPTAGPGSLLDQQEVAAAACNAAGLPAAARAGAAQAVAEAAELADGGDDDAVAPPPPAAAASASGDSTDALQAGLVEVCDGDGSGAGVFAVASTRTLGRRLRGRGADVRSTSGGTRPKTPSTCSARTPTTTSTPTSRAPTSRGTSTIAAHANAVPGDPRQAPAPQARRPHAARSPARALRLRRDGANRGRR